MNRKTTSMRKMVLYMCHTLELKIRSYTDFINLRAEGGYCNTITITVNCRDYGVFKTTGNIGTSLSLSILREVWAKPIILIGT